MMVFNWVFDIWSDFEDWILLKYVNDRAFLNLKYPFCYCYKISLDKQYFQETSKFWRIIKFSVHFCQHCKFWCLTMHCQTQKRFIITKSQALRWSIMILDLSDLGSLRSLRSRYPNILISQIYQSQKQL